VTPIAYPFRKHLWNFPPIFIWLILNIVYVSSLIISGDSFSRDLFGLVDYKETYIKVLIFFALLINFVISFSIETIWGDFWERVFYDYENPPKSRKKYLGKYNE